MTKYFSFDTEDDSHGNPFLFNFYDGCDHYTFRTVAGVAHFFSRLSGTVEIWATNLGYDLNNILQELSHAIEISYVDSRIISAKLKGSNINFKDTLNHWKMSVAEMGKRIDLPKIEVDAKNLKRLFEEDPKKIIKYCQRDCEITYRFVMEMKRKYDEMGCNLKSTIGSTSLNFFYNNFWHRPTKQEILKQNEIDFCRKGYYGGRVEIFYNRPITGNIKYVDFNSLYPAVMQGAFPCLENRFWTTRPEFGNEGMVELELEAPKSDIPYLPCRLEKRGLLFPIGNISGVYTYFEIRNALERGYRIKKIHRALEFTGTCYPFQRFVLEVYDRRLKAQRENDLLMSDTCKLLMNNLFGKFGQGNEYTKLFTLDEAKGLKNGDQILGGFVLRKTKSPYASHTNGIWACYVTAYARERLYVALQRVLDHGGLLIYCDTDSIIYESDQTIFETSNDLGSLKLEGEFEYAHFKLPKLYKLIDKKKVAKYRSKGVPRSEAGTFFETRKATFRRPYKLRESLRRNLNPKRVHKIIPNFWEITSKEIRKTYDKRKVRKDGTTSPIRL
jgi:hypothetical protein